MSQRGTAYIRVENLTDEPFYFAPKYVSIFDHQFAYEVDTRVSDPDFANGIIIPPHDRLEYREFFFISGERHPASDEIAGRIIGVCYKTEWPMADEYDII
ncbi:MAG: hypothetical protein GX374_01475, partial [Bacilli bacterium]|nr:hypothetical protein [Bacilli bacterium]